MYYKLNRVNMLSDILLVNYMRITAVVTFYWIVSIVTVFVNKTLLSDKDINLDAPFFIVWFQCLTTVVICLVMRALSRVIPGIISFPDGSPFSSKTIQAVFPLSLLFTAMIAFNSLCLKHVGVSFYYIGRSLTTVFNVLLTFVVLKQKVSWRATLCCCIISLGFFLGIDQEKIAGTLSLSGTLFGVLASLSLAFYSIQTDKVLPYVNRNVWLLSYFNNVFSCIIFIPLMVLNGEISTVFNYPGLSSIHFWFLLTLGGVCGFAIGFATSLQIKITSPLTHNISGTAKACAQTVIATFWYSEGKSPLWWLSNWIVLLSSAAYTSVRQREMAEKLKESMSVC